MIRSFRCKESQALFEGGEPRRFRAIQGVAIRKLSQLDAAHTLEFLRSPPGNHLEPLKGARGAAQYPNQPAMAYLLRVGRKRSATS